MTKSVQQSTTTTEDLATVRPAARLDGGRLAFIPFAVLLIAANLLKLSASGVHLTTASGVLQLSAQLLILCFYGLLVGVYLMRRAAAASATSRLVHLVAIAATWLPFTLPILATRATDPALVTASNVLVVVGLGWSLWSLRTLGTSFSIVPQARKVVTAGPYRWVRHPLYVGELLSLFGVVLSFPSVASVAAWCLLVLAQAFRTIHEERVLLATLSDYSDYQARTARLVPGLF